MHGVGGLDVTVEMVGLAAFTLAGSVGGVVGYYHTITVFGADRTAWTTHMLG